MNRTRPIALAILALAATVLGARPAAAGNQDFTLVNKTGVELHNLYISASEKEDWEEDVLGTDVLADGDSVTIEFSHGEEACLFDLMVKDEEGTGVYWRKVNLCKAAKVTLSCDGASCTASIE